MRSRLRDLLAVATSLVVIRAMTRQGALASVARRAPADGTAGPDHVASLGLLGYGLVSLALVAASALVVGDLLQQHEETRKLATALTRGDPKKAPPLLIRYGCAGCHTIPGVPGADGKVGPPLSNLRQRVFIAGVVRNEPDVLVRWIVEPQEIAPKAAMPVTGISEQEARNVAAWLYEH
jgi:cytochrome c